MKQVSFEEKAFEDFTNWATQDKKGYWSRRITDEHRLVYKVTETSIIIASCKYHY